MTPAHRSFNEAMIARLGPIAALRRAEATPPSLTIAGCLDSVIAALTAEIEQAPPASIVVAQPAPDGGVSELGWRAAVFHDGGRFRLHAGTHRDAMLASAFTCRQLGALDAAAAFERAADRDPAADAARRAANRRSPLSPDRRRGRRAARRRR